MANQTKKNLINQKLSIGSWLTMGHQSVAEIMAGSGFEWIAIDMEHSVIEFQNAQNLIAHIKSRGIQALVRVSKNEEVVIKRVMDAGADGVIVPMINSKQDAEQAVNFVYYPPKGKRGVGLARAQQYGTGFEEYKKWLNEEAIVIAQIEHIKAVENIDEILLTTGIDGIIIGPYDLSGSMGTPGDYERDEVKGAIKRVEEACKKHKKALGFHVILPEYEKLNEKIKAGYSFLAFSIDFYFLGNKIKEEMVKIKKYE
jgi:2-dehydro-3-deoxyglucarate aldolase